MTSLTQDLRYALRTLRRQPGFACLVTLTLALAIGANTVIFSFVNVLLIKPLPIADPDTLGWIYMVDPRQGTQRGRCSIPDLLDWRAGAPAFQGLAASRRASLTLTGRGDALRVSAHQTTVNLFEVWGVTPALGRAFAAGEDAPGAAPVALLSDRFWRRQLGADPAIVGHSLILNGRPHEVVGVLKPDIEFGNLALVDVWMPLTIDASAPRDERVLGVVGRLSPGATLEEANAQIRALSQRLQQQHAETNDGWMARVAPTREAMAGGDTWVALALLGVVVAAVLAIACANLANVVLARALGRQREIAMRAALGANRFRLVRQMLTENLLLAVAGGAVGLLFAELGLRVIRAAAFEPFFELVVMDRQVLAFAAGLALITPVLFSLLPALRSARADVSDTLKEAGVRGAGGRRHRRGRAGLVVAQVALALMLLVVAGLTLRSLVAVTRIETGFDPRGLLTLQVQLPEWKDDSPAAASRFYERLLADVRALPGVDAAAAASALPVLGDETTVRLEVAGRSAPRAGDEPWAVRAIVTPGFFETAGIPVLRGRAFLASDTAASAAVAIVSREMARRHWDNPDDALGRSIAILSAGSAPRRFEIVGIVGNTIPPDLESSVNPQIYVPHAQAPDPAMALLVKTANPAAVTPAVRAAVRNLDPDVPAYAVQTFEEGFRNELASMRIIYGMFVAFAILALMLAAGGLYGVIAYSVSQRAHEIGVRLALGAAPGDIRRMVLGQSAALTGLGMAIGLAGAAVLARVTSSLLVGVSATDPATYAGVFGVLSLVSLIAAYAPARRAMQIDPASALRAE
jgi:putative ABC transport system permease protein